MGYVVKMPKLGLEMEQGTVLEWSVEEGTEIEDGEILLEVESEKSIGEVEAREDGVLRLLAIGEGETVPPGTPIGIVAGPDEDIADLETEFDAEDEPEAGTETTVEEAVANEEAGETATDEGTTTDSGGAADVKASPRARGRAEELGVVLASVDGTGPGGAITADDVEVAADGTATEAGTGTESTAGTGTEATAEQVRASPRAKDRASDLDVDIGTVDGTGPQGAITAADVERAAESSSDDLAPNGHETGDQGTIDDAGTVAADRYHTATLVTGSEEADALIEATTLAGEAFAFDVSVLDVLLVAVSAALADHPVFNSTLEGNTHHVHERQHVALAAGDTQPDVVVTNVAERSFAERVAAREGRDESADAGTGDGGTTGIGTDEQVTFALAMGETLGGSLELPTVAGLAVDASRRRGTPTENGEGISLSRYLSCSLSYDPRAVGDRSVQEFLDTLCDSIERAPELLVRTYR